MGNKGLFPGVAVPLAFFCTLFFRHRKKSVSAPWDGKSLSAPESARQSPRGQGFAPAGAPKGFPLALWKPSGHSWRKNPRGINIPAEKQGGFPLAPLHPLRGVGISMGQGACAYEHTKGLSSGQTIGAVRTAVRSACCLPELRVANRLRRLYPLDTRFPSFPPAPLRIAN